jgi:hypothetical protein
MTDWYGFDYLWCAVLMFLPTVNDRLQCQSYVGQNCDVFDHSLPLYVNVTISALL